MSLWVDQEFAEKIFSTLPRFRRVSTGTTYKLNARCPVCGDSQKDPNKARFWCYSTEKGLRVHCFNCDIDMWFNKFLKENDEDLYREYLLEKRKDQVTSPQKQQQKFEVEKFSAVLPVIDKLEYCERLDRLPKDHPIIKYVSHRCIPEVSYKRLWFTNLWPALVNSVNPGTYKNESNEPRLVIPIFNKKGEIESFQGRALRNGVPQKYMTIKAHDKATKIYGLDTVDESKRVYIVEGPIDSLFIPNAISITGGSLDLNIVPFKDNRVWVLDNEPRHPDTIKRMRKLIDAGEKVLFWDKSPWKLKDINEMVQKENADVKDILEYINDNFSSGLMAKLRLEKYARVNE